MSTVRRKTRINSTRIDPARQDEIAGFASCTSYRPFPPPRLRDFPVCFLDGNEISVRFYSRHLYG